jgi:hypothetical protein
MRSWPTLAALLALCATARAQNYSIDWYKVSGGGGGSTGSVFQVSGTIGQHDAGGPMTAGSYSLVGGFWSLTAIQTPGAPILSITTSGSSSATLHWLYTDIAFHLQQSASLDNANWVNVTNAVGIVNGTNQVTISPAIGNQFYRLKFP